MFTLHPKTVGTDQVFISSCHFPTAVLPPLAPPSCLTRPSAEACRKNWQQAAHQPLLQTLACTSLDFQWSCNRQKMFQFLMKTGRRQTKGFSSVSSQATPQDEEGCWLCPIPDGFHHFFNLTISYLHHLQSYSVEV